MQTSQQTANGKITKAEKTRARLRPAVVFEYCPYPLVERGERPESLLEVFDRAGYLLREEATMTP